MLSRRAAVMVLAGLAPAGLLGGCDEGTGDTPRALAERVTAAIEEGAGEIADRLVELGLDVDAGDVRSIDPADVRCPVVRDPAPGDRATCAVEIAGAEVSVDVEFGAGAEAVTVVRVEVAP